MVQAKEAESGISLHRTETGSTRQPRRIRVRLSDFASARLVLALALNAFVIGPILGCQARHETPRHVILITADTLRADRLGSYGSTLDLTPNLDRLALQSIVFDIAYTPAPFTLAGIGSLLTGRYPEELGIETNHSALVEDVPTLAGVLRARGWRTAAIVGNAILHRSSALDRGFEEYDDRLPNQEQTRGVAERIASPTTNAAISVIDELGMRSDEQLFLWVHYQDPHGPYTPPPGIREQFLDAERNRPDGKRRLPILAGQVGMRGIPAYQALEGRHDIAFYRAGYDGEIHYFDREFGRLLSALEDRDLLDTSIIVFTSDHGEGFGQKNYWFSHGELLTEDSVRIPLLIRYPGVEPGHRLDPVSLVDVTPTILGLLGISAPQATGRDLLRGSSGDRPIYLSTLGTSDVRKHGIVHRGFKSVRNEGGEFTAEEVMPVGPFAGNRTTGTPPPPDEMESTLGNLRAELRPQASRTRELSAETLRQLLNLGYIEPSDP